MAYQNTTYTVDGITDSVYMRDLPDALIRTLRKAEKTGLFKDFICGICGTANELDWREEKIKKDGLHFICDCGAYDIVGMDIIEEARDEYESEILNNEEEWRSQ